MFKTATSVRSSLSRCGEMCAALLCTHLGIARPAKGVTLVESAQAAVSNFVWVCMYDWQWLVTIGIPCGVDRTHLKKQARPFLYHHTALEHPVSQHLPPNSFVTQMLHE